jgi:MoaA/NifB/PqqE/SkfB family radical SAM enzyme
MGLLPNIFKAFGAKGITKTEDTAEDRSKRNFNLHRDRSNHQSVCFAPFVNMIFSEDGSVRACCHNRENILGSYPQQNIREIWSSANANKFRQKMQEYQFMSGCWVCSADYKQGNFDQIPAPHFDTLPRHGTYPVMMEFLLDNTCNLKCIMCYGELSSSIRRNRDKLPPLKNHYGDVFLGELQEFIPYLKETRFCSSGEAFLIKLHFKLWESLIEKNPSCLIVIQTNGTVMNARIKELLERGNFKIGVSLDSLRKETYEAIRINASFDRVMENIRYFADYSKRHGKTLNISTCVMRQNWNELPDFIDFCNKIGATATFHKVWNPLRYALHNLPAAKLQEIYTELSGYDFPSGTPLEEVNKKHYEYYVSVIGSWLKDARNRKDDQADTKGLTDDELHNLIILNFKTYIRDQTMLEEKKQELIDLCESKINDVCKLCESEQHKRAWFDLLWVHPISMTLSVIKTSSPERLYEILCNQLKQG